MTNWKIESYYDCGIDDTSWKVINVDTGYEIVSDLDYPTAKLIADAPKMLKALKYYKYYCSGNESSISVFEQMVNDALGIDSELEQKEKAELEEQSRLKRHEDALRFLNSLQKIREDFKGEKNKTECEMCVDILKFIESNESDNFHIKDFYNRLIDINHTYNQLVLCIDYICNLEPQILRKQYVVVDEDDTWWDVDDSDIDFEDETLVHPESGELLSFNDENVIIVYERV